MVVTSLLVTLPWLVLLEGEPEIQSDLTEVGMKEIAWLVG